MSLGIFAEMKSVESSLDYHLDRQGVLAANVTNADTPNYKPKDLVFSESLTNAGNLLKTMEGHVQGSENARYEVLTSNEPQNLDGNGVRLEKAMAQLAGNTIRYNQGIELTRKQLGLLRYAATAGGR
jgi:flagellar basal-body rod protein FlgB